MSGRVGRIRPCAFLLHLPSAFSSFPRPSISTRSGSLVPTGADDATALSAAAEASEGGSGRASVDGDGGGGGATDSTSEKEE